MKNNFNDIVNNFFKNCQDRGMKKWQGFMLSDHIATLNREKEKKQKYIPKKIICLRLRLVRYYCRHLPIIKVLLFSLKKKR